jgi:hypothetical protein
MDSPRKKRKRAVSYKTGEKGSNRVRLFSHARDGSLYLEYRDGASKKSISLGHSDENQGKHAADTLALSLRENEPARPTVLTLRALFDKYEREETPLKGVHKQKHDVRARKLFEVCWSPSAKVKDLDLSDWNRFIQQRRKGTLRPNGRKGETKEQKEKGVRDRVIAYDLKHLRAVIRWAQSVRENGSPLLVSDPCKGFPLPSEASPRRPTTNDEEYSKLEVAASELEGIAPLFLLMVHETGHRCSAVGLLRWSDLELNEKDGESWVRWREENDKIGFQHRTPLSTGAVKALKTAQKLSGCIGEAWVFPAPGRPLRKGVATSGHVLPVSRHYLRDLWQKLEVAAGVERQPGRGWHSLRRKFATDLKETPLKDLCYMGGWKDAQTVLKCYQQPDEGTMRKALANRERRVVSG